MEEQVYIFYQQRYLLSDYTDCYTLLIRFITFIMSYNFWVNNAKQVIPRIKKSSYIICNL